MLESSNNLYDRIRRALRRNLCCRMSKQRPEAKFCSRCGKPLKRFDIGIDIARK